MTAARTAMDDLVKSSGASGIAMPWRVVMATGGTALIAASAVALFNAGAGVAPMPVQAKQLAVIIHVAAVVPAVPLGLFVLLSRKGDRRHRMLGGIWMLMMLVTAISALFIRVLNDGQFSYIHLFVPLVIVTIVRSIAAARQGRIAAHRRHLIGLFIGALLLPGLFAFLPGRIMWVWLIG